VEGQLDELRIVLVLLRSGRVHIVNDVPPANGRFLQELKDLVDFPSAALASALKSATRILARQGPVHLGISSAPPVLPFLA